MVKSEKYNNTILAVAEDDSVDEVECMMRNKSVQIVGGVLALTGITYVGSGCQSIQDKLDVIQSQTTTREVSIAEEMISEEKNTEKSIVTEQKTETDVADDIPSEENIDDAVYLTQYEEIISRYIELNHQKLEYGDLTNI